MSDGDTRCLPDFSDVVRLRIVQAEGDLHTRTIEKSRIFQSCTDYIKARGQIVQRVQHDGDVRRGEFRGNTPGFLATLDDSVQLLAFGQRDDLPDIRRTIDIKHHRARTVQEILQ